MHYHGDDLTPFILAAVGIHCDSLEALLSAGADLSFDILGGQATRALHFLVDSGARGAAACVRHLLERSSDLATQTVTYGNNNRPLDTLQQAYDRGAYDDTPEEYAAIYELLSASSPINPNTGGSKRTF